MSPKYANMWIWHRVGGRNGSLVVSIFKRWKATAPGVLTLTHIRAVLFKYLKPWCMANEYEHSTVVRCGLMAFKCFSEIQTTSENYPKTTPHKWIHAIAMYAIFSPSLWLQQAVFLLHTIETGWHKPSFCVTRALFAISSHLNHWQQLDLWYVFISTILLRWAAKAREKEGMREKMKDKK